MKIPMTSKLPDVGTTIFAVMSQLAQDCKAINLSQGFPSFEPPAELIDRIDHYLRSGANQYAPMPGVPALGRAIAEKIARIQGRKLDPDTEITVCTGATEGLFSAIQAIVRNGDEVIVFDPAYDSYEPAVTLAGGHTVHVPLAISDDGFDFSIDWQRLQDALNDKTRLVIINFPHNPTGAILSADDLQQLAELLRDTRAYLLSDEVYEHIVFDGEPHVSALSVEELWERSFVVSSFGKTYHATGWKVGYCTAPPELSAEFRKVHQFTTFAVNTPVQHALADFLQGNPAFHERLPTFYQQKRDLFCSLLEDSRFRLHPARSTFFQIVDYGEISDENDVALAKRWTEEIGVASIPLTVFCDQPFTGTRLRFCFAKDDETLETACEKLSRL
ncbi:MAG: methionine aminotransferase [Gammaproteobacteria bacterium]|jgi:methionine aminotransferase|nr:methionine aminotransferase [Gammaproteobacteria bacterium]MDH3758883.1 methionine aminotransferase [Gammaproteobacteria bacterium]MDH3849406.1 methionine aminotransferase [Gammaproteobacteria bacterium]MDH3862851.1 methionine aminotransferase [Gammaproteobacteria bacterium]MDH3904396.1 methionine aminotransferase [Gammaproteobacteria bacterium]